MKSRGILVDAADIAGVMTGCRRIFGPICVTGVAAWNARADAYRVLQEDGKLRPWRQPFQ